MLRMDAPTGVSMSTKAFLFGFFFSIPLWWLIFRAAGWV